MWGWGGGGEAKFRHLIKMQIIEVGQTTVISRCFFTEIKQHQSIMILYCICAGFQVLQKEVF